ncbi:hypothetical protein N9A49_05140 [Salibacteraceae bacterium]|nr:hypothetical protein [Salibacteraceae bacterium]
MKKFNLLFVALIGASALTFTSCTDECKDVVCENGGTCDEETGACDCPANFYGESCETECVNGTYASGECSCDDGYEGNACGTEEREKFIADWTYTTGCAPGSSFPSSITSAADNVVRATLSNLTGFNDNSAYAVVDGTTFTVPSQIVVDEEGDTWTVEGASTATLAGDAFSITINYAIDGTSSTCVLSYTK